MPAAALVFLLMLTGPVFAAPRILVHGHRGARAVRPENTLAAFEYSIQAGADVLELDLAVTSDNILVVSHDPALPKAICTGPGGTRVIREMTFQQLRRWDCGGRRNAKFPRQQLVPGASVPSLDEVLDLASQGSFEFNIESKIRPDRPRFTPPPEDFARLLVEAIRRHRLESRCIIQSFDFRTLHAARRLAPEIRRSALYEGPPRDLVAMARQAEAGILSPHHRLVTASLVKEAHAAGLQVVPWTANKPSQWERLAAAGVDAIITDDPAALVAWLKQQGLR